MRLKIDTIKDLYRFVEKAQKCDGEVYVEQGFYRVNASSIMGLFCLDLLKPIFLINAEKYGKEFEGFAYDEKM